MNITRSSRDETRAVLISGWIIHYVLPVGILTLLTGLFWLGDRSLYHRLYYLLVSAPTLAIFLLGQKDELKRLLRNPLIIIFILFGAYMIATLCWSDTDHALSSLARRPFNILMLFLAFGVLSLKSPDKLYKIFSIAAKCAVVIGGLSLVYFFLSHYANGGTFANLARFNGYGALYNPLLTSHIYGFFTAFFLALWFSGRYSHPALPVLSVGILIIVVLSTGSRTPLLALTLTLIWLAICYGNRRSILAISIMLSFACTLILSYPEVLIQRGLSHRPEIWLGYIKQGMEKLWLGHGYDHHLTVNIATLEVLFSDPHNMELSVFLSGGVIGLTLWLALYAAALFYSWCNRDNPLIMLASALIVFGFGAGLTEGGGFMSRPKEHWFLVWIPFALLSSAWVTNSQHNEEYPEKSVP